MVPYLGYKHTPGQNVIFTSSDSLLAYKTLSISADTQEFTLRKKGTFSIKVGNDFDGYTSRTFSIPKWINPQGDRKSGVPAGCNVASLSDLTSSVSIGSPPSDLGIEIGNLMAEYGYINDYNIYPIANNSFVTQMLYLASSDIIRYNEKGEPEYKYVHTDFSSVKNNYGSRIDLVVTGITTPLKAIRYACLE